MSGAGKKSSVRAVLVLDYRELSKAYGEQYISEHAPTKSEVKLFLCMYRFFNAGSMVRFNKAAAKHRREKSSR